MLEPTLVLREGRVDLKEKPEGGRLRVGARALMRLYSGPNGSSTPVFAGEAHDCVGVQLHVVRVEVDVVGRADCHELSPLAGTSSLAVIPFPQESGNRVAREL